MIKNTWPNKSGNPTTLKKIIITVRKFSNLCAYIWREFAEGILQVLSFTVLCFKSFVKKHCVVKILLATWETFLYESNCNYIFCKFTFTNLLLPLCSAFVKTNKRIKFSASWWSCIKINSCLLFIVSRALFQRHAKFNRLL